MSEAKPTISISSALMETLLLWKRDFWFLLLLTLVFKTPGIIYARMTLGHVHSTGTPGHPQSLVFAWLSLAAGTGLWLLTAMYIAAVLGLLTRPFPEKANTPWSAIWQGIKNDTWILARVLLLLGVIAILAAIPAGLLLRFLKPSLIVGTFLLSIALLLMKYALAYPLVVMEKMRARKALQRSWEMTRGHFGYVFGCYLVLWLIGWAVGYLFGLGTPNALAQPTGIFFLKNSAIELVNSLWIILSWCMYLQIKEADTPEPPARLNQAKKARR